jgi:hypothetical protein
MSEQILDKTYRNDANVEIGKFTVVVEAHANYANGCGVPAAANAANPLGIAQNSIIPDATTDFAAGVYQIVSGTAWPAGAIPASGLGRAVRVRKAGISQCVAAGVIARGDRLNVADNQGRVKTINEVAGTVVYEVGQAEEAAGQAGDVIRVRLTLVVRHS